MTGSRPEAGDTVALRSALAGLLSLAAAEEQGPDNWAAVPLVAHNNKFKAQPAERLVALAAGQVPATYGETDHSSAEAGYSLACAQARTGQLDEAARTLTEAIGANPDLRANAGRDSDLVTLRDQGQLAALLAPVR